MLQRIMIKANKRFKLNFKRMKINKIMFDIAIARVRRKNKREEIDQLDLLFVWISSYEID